MTLVLLEKGLVLEASSPKIEDKQVPGVCIYIYIDILSIFAKARPIFTGAYLHRYTPEV